MKYRMTPKIKAVMITAVKLSTAIETGDLASRFFCPGSFLKRSKLISIPERNIKIITPKLESSVNEDVSWTILKALFPRRIPATISATAVGTLETLNRAIAIGIISAANIIISIDNCCIIFPLSRKNNQPIIRSFPGPRQKRFTG